MGCRGLLHADGAATTYIHHFSALRAVHGDGTRSTVAVSSQLICRLPPPKHPSTQVIELWNCLPRPGPGFGIEGCRDRLATRSDVVCGCAPSKLYLPWTMRRRRIPVSMMVVLVLVLVLWFMVVVVD